MTPFELDYRNFERLPQIHQLFTIFNSTIEKFLKTLETADIDMTKSHSIIGPIVNRNLGNTFQHQNKQNQRQHIHKNTSQHCQPISYQRPRTSSIPYPKEDCLGCETNNKCVREFLMQHDRKLETFTLRGLLFIKKHSYREQLLRNNHKNGS